MDERITIHSIMSVKTVSIFLPCESRVDKRVMKKKVVFRSYATTKLLCACACCACLLPRVRACLLLFLVAFRDRLFFVVPAADFVSLHVVRDQVFASDENLVAIPLFDPVVFALNLHDFADDNFGLGFRLGFRLGFDNNDGCHFNNFLFAQFG